MITLKEFPNKSFATKEEAFKELVLNKKTLIAAKKAVIKHADAISYHGNFQEKTEAIKAGNTDLRDVNTITVKAVSNAVNYFDSHGDVSMPGSWNRTAKNTKDGLHLQEHKMQFDKIISDEVKFSVEKMTWRDLGFDYEGETEVLMMESKVHKEDNPYMFERYIKGKVKNHSSGLRYVNIGLAINSEEKWAREEKEIWDKYIDQIVNKDEVEEAGYFWVVFEQKIIENSAVPKGSNPATPTISVESAESTSTTDENSEEDSTSQSETKSLTNLNFY